MPGASPSPTAKDTHPQPPTLSMLKCVRPQGSAAGGSLHLSSHVRACEVDGQVILLDLIRGRYLGIGARQARGLAEVVDGWPLPSRSIGATAVPTSSPDISSVATRLLAQGILSDGRCDALTAMSVKRPEATLSPQHTSASGASITTARVIRFVKAVASANLSLRFRSLQSIAIQVSTRRQRSASRSVADINALRDSVSVYQRLRPLVFTVRDKCLFDSLALLEFLAAEDVHPQWVIGVKTHPFAAHSWVQSGPLVLNDHHEHVRLYRPILGA
jgi:hypothetical protein